MSSLLADGPIVAFAVGVLGQLPPELVPAISLVGGLFLLYLAISRLERPPCARAARQDRGARSITSSE
jgi:threonine/homoserine/homoserine lactone efflux protein